MRTRWSGRVRVGLLEVLSSQLMSFRERIKAELTDLRRLLGLNRDERDQAWAAAAAAKGGEFFPEVRRLVGWKPPRIEVTLDDVAIHVDLHIESTGQSQQTYTRFQCLELLDGGLDFKIYPSGFVGSLGTAMGFEDVELGGDDEFDAQFVVRARNQEACRRAWTPTAKRLMRTSLSKATIVARKELITLQIPDALYEREPLEAGIDVLAEVGGHGREWLAGLRSLQGAEWQAPTGPWDERTPGALRFERRGVAIHVESVSRSRRVSTVLMTDSPRELPSFQLEIEADGKPKEPPPDGLFSPSTSAQLPAIAPAAFLSDGRSLLIELPEHPPANQVEAAVELLAEVSLGISDHGTYR